MNNLNDLILVLAFLALAYFCVTFFTAALVAVNKVMLNLKLGKNSFSKKEGKSQAKSQKFLREVATLERVTNSNISMATPLNKRFPKKAVDDFEAVPAYIRAGYKISNGIMLKPAKPAKRAVKA